MIVITEIRRSTRFERDWKSSPVDVQRSATEALRKLVGNPSANGLRLHRLTGIRNPAVFKIDVHVGKAWQISLEISGTTAILRRFCTHKEIDRSP